MPDNNQTRDGHGWISVLEAKPAPYTDVLWFIPAEGRKKKRLVIGYLQKDGSVFVSAAKVGATRDCTHWQPLPDDPVIDEFMRFILDVQDKNDA